MARTKRTPRKTPRRRAFELDRGKFLAALRGALASHGRGYRVQTTAVDALYDAASSEIDRLVEEARVPAEAEGAEIDARHVALARRMLCM